MLTSNHSVRPMRTRYSLDPPSIRAPIPASPWFPASSSLRDRADEAGRLVYAELAASLPPGSAPLPPLPDFLGGPARL